MVRLLTALVLIVLILTYVTVWRDTDIEGVKEISIERGASVTEIIEELKDEEIIRSATAAKLYVALSGSDVNIQAGEYTFSGRMSYTDVLRILKGGAEGKRERTLTFIEGWTISDMARYLEEQNIVSEKEFIRAAEKTNGSVVSQYIPVSRESYEGYLFPDTYNVFEEVTAGELVEKILITFDVKLDKMIRSDIERQGKTIDEIIIMASILERELKTFEEKQLGAGVLYNRLENGIALQTDSTVNYITGKNTPRASAKDIQVDSPYNTYRYRGLPPGPISNPGLESIRAAVYPEEHDYLYFLTTPEGDAIFNKTLEGHNFSKAKYY